MRVPSRLVLAALLLPALSACDTLRRDAGLVKQPPDEFAVVTKAPLIIPPDFNLRPPAPGAPPLNQQPPTTAAATALFNSNDPATVAAGLKGDFSPGERMLLAHAGVENTDPAIRAELSANMAGRVGSDPAFTDRVLNSAASTQAPASKSNPAQIKKDSGGWFDWF